MDNSLNTKKKLILGIGTVAVVVFAIVFALWLNVLAPPSKQDYQNALKAENNFRYDQISDAYDAYNVASVSSDAAKTRGPLATFNKEISTHITNLKAFNNQKALRDDQVKTAYEQLKTADGKYVAYATGFVRLTQSFKSCDDVFKVSISELEPRDTAVKYDAAVKDCLADLDELAKSPTNAYSNYGKTFSSIVRERKTVIDNYGNSKLTFTALGDKLKTINARITELNGLNNDLAKARPDSDISQEEGRMVQLLEKKVKQS